MNIEDNAVRMGKKLNRWHRSKDYFFLGLWEKKGNYFNISPHGPVYNALGDKLPTKKQMTEAILRLILSNDCDTIYCYKGNKIDSHMTRMAQEIIADLCREGHALHGRDIKVSQKPMEDLEPWRGGILGKPFVEAVRDWNGEREMNNNFKEAAKAEKKSLKDEGRMTRKFDL